MKEMKNHPIVACIGAFFGLTSVVMGAAGDHLFSGYVTAESADRFDTAFTYHQLYAVLIFCAGLITLDKPLGTFFGWALWAHITGVIIFCVSLYCSIIPSLAFSVFFTPVGGLLLMTGWVLAIIGLLRLKS